MSNYFQGNSEHPQHISVGAILINDKNEICVHHILKDDLEGYWVDMGVDDVYILMRETLNPNESLEEALRRGLLEEFGAEADILDYVGAIQSKFSHQSVEVTKTTIYFVCKLISQDESKRHGDIESKTKLEWQKADFLIEKMKNQPERFGGRTDIDESSILEKLSI